ncbi:hypothetical protein [Caproicibacterium sp. XB2]
MKSPLSTAKDFAPKVAPYTGAWIEIRTTFSSGRTKSSLPTRERGLK